MGKYVYGCDTPQIQENDFLREQGSVIEIK